MSKFILTQKNIDVAAQVAVLVNMGGQLVLHQTPQGVLHNPITYMIELNRDKVIGVIGLEQKDKTKTEMKHLCVHPDYRRKGIGLYLLKKGIELSPTPYAYGLVRADNEINIRNNYRAGLSPIGKYWGRNCYIIVFAARRNHESIQHKTQG